MKTSELKKIVEAKGYRLHEGYASVSIKDKMVTIANITKSGSTFSMLDGIGFEVAQAIVDYAYTPLEEREEVKKNRLKVKNMQCPHCERSFYNYEGMIDPTLQGDYCQFCGELLDWSDYE